MKGWSTGFVCACLAVLAGSAAAQVAPIEAAHLVAGDRSDVETLPAIWNRAPVVFVNYVAARPEGTQRLLYVVHRDAKGRLQQTRVTAIDEDGGPPEIAAIGFANADRDPARELIVIQTWPQQHYDYGGAFYEVRLFDDLKPGQLALIPLDKVSKHFALGCECNWREGKTEHYRFKTIPAVQRELRRMGY
ncbi:MAG: hypothetical protein WBL74_11190 [Novosphingobium sp.]|uniref:hypothetical protein n=1 Tax=Novosphingobium sp. TaxID=1874826 RepID=UPI003C7C59E0